ncbi:adenylate/guanylate cyclase domain-containing protein [Marispirochaeta aestuarii]|uniref:adenylate/guanylate cyclase domain-containing protein n=1 Tax=Marispirochaeta aestuarii TaxID=1963862 RepID=UPI0029C96B4A|nr:adenylate/guanylate cyclase domain-containing protein [Marispirochaeta aestuarii]
MSIRAKIVLVVVPLLVAALLISGTISSYSARSGMTRIAMSSLGFKAQELNKYMDSQWNLLVTNELSEEEEYVAVARDAMEAYAESVVRTPTELILAVSSEGDPDLELSTGDLSFGPQDREEFRRLIDGDASGWIEFSLNGSARVGHAFRFSPFQWLVVVSEDEAAFYREVREILVRNAYVLGGAILVSLILLFFFAGILTGPLRRVVSTMRGIISNNDLSARVAVEYRDETGDLAHTFNIMVEELQKAYNQIKGFAFKAVLAQKNEHKIRNIFQKYVPKDVIDSLFSNPESMLVGENRVLAVLFSDIRSFTTISEGYMPDELVNALNAYFEIMVDIIMDHGGIIDKYIGDAIMAFFGAPVKHKNDALNAVAVALKMQEALKEFNRSQEEKGKPKFITGIGINYGVVTVGNIGSQKKMDYTVIGDMVNLGSRLEGLTKPYKQDVIFSESVYRKVKDTYPCRLVDKVQVKGKTIGENIYTAYENRLNAKQEQLLRIHHAAMARYYRQDFSGARQYFEAVLRLDPADFLASLYIERCDRYLKDPPPANWNGVEILTSK